MIEYWPGDTALRDNLWMRQGELFTATQMASMRVRPRRRNYSVEAEEFRRGHAEHRSWGLGQRHARKLSRLYGSTTAAEAAFQRRADEALSRPPSVRATAAPSPEPVVAEIEAEATVSAPVLPAPVVPLPVRS